MSDRPILLDTFCGAGGATRGYQNAGFYVVGVDIEPQPNYCGDEFIRADALIFIREHGARFDAIHASPPCQGYSKTRVLSRSSCDYPKLIEPVRDLLKNLGKPYVIENVSTAPLINATLLCGAMFALKTYRHRLFETSYDMPLVMHPGHGVEQDKLYGPSKTRARGMVTIVGHAGYKGATERYHSAMGIDWMSTDELCEAIPPAYTEFIGAHLLAALEPRR